MDLSIFLLLEKPRSNNQEANISHTNKWDSSVFVPESFEMCALF